MVAERPSQRSGSDNGRGWTLSVALPGSILSNAQSDVLRTYVAGCIARSLAVFQVDEVIVFGEDDQDRESDELLELLIAYLEVPQYLRRHLFGREPRLRNAGLLNPLDAPHHLREREFARWREGVVVAPGFRRGDPNAAWCADNETIVGMESDLVDVGWRDPIRLRGGAMDVGTRVTVDFGTVPDRPLPTATLSSRDAPRDHDGRYWGYRVRRAEKLSGIFTGCPFPGGYDKVLGTSERGRRTNDGAFQIGTFRHLMLVFGGVKGLEHAAALDSALVEKGVGSAVGIGELFDDYINTCPDQGSRTIRTEEAIPISLASLRPHIEGAEKAVPAADGNALEEDGESAPPKRAKKANRRSRA